jgi:hypothetical protein
MQIWQWQRYGQKDGDIHIGQASAGWLSVFGIANLHPVENLASTALPLEQISEMCRFCLFYPGQIQRFRYDSRSDFY